MQTDKISKEFSLKTLLYLCMHKAAGIFSRQGYFIPADLEAAILN